MFSKSIGAAICQLTLFSSTLYLSLSIAHLDAMATHHRPLWSLQIQGIHPSHPFV